MPMKSKEIIDVGVVKVKFSYILAEKLTFLS